VGTTVRLNLKRAGQTEPLNVSVTREVIETPSVEWRTLDEDPSVGYVHIRMFTERTVEETRQALQDLQAKGALRLIVDLRDNGGGLLDAAVGVASQFFPPVSCCTSSDATSRNGHIRSKRAGWRSTSC